VAAAFFVDLQRVPDFLIADAFDFDRRPTMMSVSRSLGSLPLRHLQRTFPQKTVVRSLATNFPRDRDGGSALNFFGRPRLPTNKGIMFVPQQEAWVDSLVVC
jgi:hypothetical protein